MIKSNLQGKEKLKREARIDIIRGYALVTICVNHISWLCNQVASTGFRFPSLTYYGYSSSAEIFFFVSGYMVGAVYLRKEKYELKLLKRAFYLYQRNVLLFLTLILICLTLQLPQLYSLTRLDSFYLSPINQSFNFLTFSFTPLFGELLFTYTILMLAAIPLIYLLKKSILVYLVVVTLIYIFAQVFPEVRFQDLAVDNGLWPVNALAYQSLFMVGIALGNKALLTRLFVYLDNNKFILSFLSILLFFGLVIKRYDLIGINHSWLVDKGNLGPIRILHFTIVFLFLASVLSVFKRFLNIGIFRLVAAIGQHSLKAYMIGVICAYLSLALWIYLPKMTMIYLALILTSVMCMYAIPISLQKMLGKRKLAQN